MSATYCIRMIKCNESIEANKIIQNLVNIGISEDKARILITKNNQVVKKGVSKDIAEWLLEKLEKCGLECAIEEAISTKFLQDNLNTQSSNIQDTSKDNKRLQEQASSTNTGAKDDYQEVNYVGAQEVSKTNRSNEIQRRDIDNSATTNENKNSNNNNDTFIFISESFTVFFALYGGHFLFSHFRPHIILCMISATIIGIGGYILKLIFNDMKISYKKFPHFAPYALAAVVYLILSPSHKHFFELFATLAAGCILFWNVIRTGEFKWNI